MKSYEIFTVLCNPMLHQISNTYVRSNICLLVFTVIPVRENNCIPIIQDAYNGGRLLRQKKWADCIEASDVKTDMSVGVGCDPEKAWSGLAK